MNMFNEYSYKDYLRDFSLQDKLRLIDECRKLLSAGQSSILEPLEVEVTQNNYRLMKFIHDSVLFQRPQLDKSKVTWMFDPATESDTLDSFIKDNSVYEVGQIKLDILEGELKISRQTLPVNINHKGVQLLNLLLEQSPELVTYEDILAFVESDPAAAPAEAVASLRKDLLNYLSQQGFSKTSINYIKVRIVNQEIVGYKLIS